MSSSQDKQQADDDVIREIGPEDPVFGYLHGEPVDAAKQKLYQKRSQYFEDAFALREPYNTPRRRVNQDSAILVEIRMNIMIRPDKIPGLLSMLSARLAEIYQRPESAILITMDHDCFLRFGGGTGPAYLITISGLASSFAPLMNARNAAVLQAEMRELVAIPEKHGVIKYVPMEEENLASGGTTMKAAIENLEQAAKSEYPGVVKNLSRSMSKKLLRSKRSNSSPPIMPTLPETSVPTTTENVATTENVVTVATTVPAKKSTESKITKGARSIRQFFSH
ncbi:hypothetical protein VTN77DRAFT_3253 [Rasamsonia byssochlamydoides]|uniref:uncharacterized protein n=1 Tax=Rasamsonia byssochlamydoides TaxID=89139 RepID=UPI003742A2AF